MLSRPHWPLSLLFPVLLTNSLLYAAEGVELEREFIYESAPFPECHASTIAETPFGLVTAWFGGTEEKDPDVGIWVSRKIAEGWSEPVEVVNGVQSETLRYPCWNPVLFQYPNGPLTLFYKVGPNPADWWGMWTNSLDGGITWSPPQRLPGLVVGPIKNKPILLDDGTLLCGCSSEHDGWRIHFEISPYANRGWERIGPIEDSSTFNAIQPAFLIHRSADGSTPPKLQVLCRSKEGSIVTSWSSDSGRTWTPLEKTNLPNPNSGVDSVTLKDGRHLLIYNHTPRGRSPLNLAISDDGVNWRAAHLFETEKGEYSYPAIIQTADGLVHATYTWKRQKVRHVVIDPARLTNLLPIREGRWPDPQTDPTESR
jgi:predicted neuraminidase